jgi:serine/threonine protein kinase
MNIQNDEEQKENYKEIVLWQNGKNKSYSFKYKIPIISSPSKPSLSQFKKEIILYIKTNKYNESSINEIIRYNRLKELDTSIIKMNHLYTIKESDLEESDIPYLNTNDVLFFAFDNSSFQDSNHFYQYEFVRWIKSGGYGKVFLAKKIITGKEYAIKQIDTSNFSTEEVYNISRENLILRTMNHKNVIKLYDSFTYDKKFFTVMDYARGGELTLLLEGNDNNKLNENECKKIFKQIYDAVCYIHQRNIIHRDLKPNNILFLDEEKTHIVIIDFGISGFSNGNNREKIKAGTTLFLAPETACGKEFCSNRKLDIWALGIILFRMIEGVYPFDGKSSKEVLNNILKKKLEFNKKIKMSKAMKSLIEGMLEKNHRFRIDDDSELFSKWFEFIPTRKNSTIIINKISKDPIFNTTNKNENNNNNKEFMNSNEECKKENDDFPIFKKNTVRGNSLKNANKFKLYVNLNNDDKLLIKNKLNSIEKNNKNNNNEISDNIKNVKLKNNLNINSVISSQEVVKSDSKKNQLILPLLSVKNKRMNYDLSSPFKKKIDLKKQRHLIKTNLPKNLFNLNNCNDIEDDIAKKNYDNKNENLNYKNYDILSNYTSKKREISDFKTKIYQSINCNQLFNNDKNHSNKNNNIIPSILRNNNTQNNIVVKEIRCKSLAQKKRNVSSSNLNFPLIED